MKRKFAGEFRVLTYGDVSVQELFIAAKERPQLTPGMAGISDKSSFVEYVLPHGVRLDILLKQLRERNCSERFKELQDMYWNPAGPAIAIMCGRSIRRKAFQQMECPTPPVMVVFIGTSFINDS